MTQLEFAEQLAYAQELWPHWKHPAQAEVWFSSIKFREAAGLRWAIETAFKDEKVGRDCPVGKIISMLTRTERKNKRMDELPPEEIERIRNEVAAENGKMLAAVKSLSQEVMQQWQDYFKAYEPHYIHLPKAWRLAMLYSRAFLNDVTYIIDTPRGREHRHCTVDEFTQQTRIAATGLLTDSLFAAAHKIESQEVGA